MTLIADDVLHQFMIFNKVFERNNVILFVKIIHLCQAKKTVYFSVVIFKSQVGIDRMCLNANLKNSVMLKNYVHNSIQKG